MDPTPSRQTESEPASRRQLHPVRTTIVSLLLIVSFVAGVGADRSGWLGGNAAADSSFTDIPQFKILEETYSQIRAHYVDSKNISDADLLYGAASGMVDALGDTGHSTFLTPEEAKAEQQELNGELECIGIYVDTTGDQPVVIAPIPDSPAMRAGLKAGDVIVAIDGKATKSTDAADWTKQIRGKPGTNVTLTVQHANATTTEEVMIERAKITVNPVSWKMLPGNIAWVQLSEFSNGAGDKLGKALTAAKQAGATGVILDLRNNPGGFVNEADKVASQFMPKGTVLFKEQDRAGEITNDKTTGANGAWRDGPLVVLVNGNTASAAEIVSASLRDNHRATLVGETTVGMGTVLVPYTLSDGSQAVLGVAIFLAPNGETIWKVGVTPDQQVALKAGVQPALTQQFEERSVSLTQIKQAQDQQLLAGYEVVVKSLVPPATPAA